MSTKLSNLVTKKKSELQEIADNNSVKYSSTTKKKQLIKKICQATGQKVSTSEEHILTLGAEGIKQKADEFGIEYTTKKETQRKILKSLNQETNQNPEDKENWKSEFKKAIRTAESNVLREERSYKILETDEEKVFNVRPSFMKHPEEYNLLMTIHITEYAKEML